MDRGLSFRYPCCRVLVDQVYIAALVKDHIVLPLDDLKSGAEPGEGEESGALKHASSM